MLVMSSDYVENEFSLLLGEGGRFSGGFDINVFQQVHKSGMISCYMVYSLFFFFFGFIK